MANYIYGAISLTGGITGSLDSIDGADLQDQDSCIVFTSGAIYFYWLDDDNGGAESSPEIISPDNNAGNKRWVLIYYRAADVDIDTSNLNGVLSATEDDVQKALELMDDMFDSADFTIGTGSVALDDDILKSIITDSGTVSGTSHSLTFNGVGRIDTAADGTSEIDISIADLNTVTKVGVDTLTASNDIVIGNTAGGGYTLTLPSAADKDVLRIIKKSNSNTLVLQADGSETIEGDSTISLDVEDDMVTLVSNGSNRWTVENTTLSTSLFNGVLTSTDNTIQQAFDTLDDMFDSTAFIVTAGNVSIDDTGIDHDNLLNTHNLSTDIDHGGLAGKDDDDHLHYSLSNGTRAFTGTVSGITPTIDANLTTKGYVDSFIQGLDWQESVLSRANYADATAEIGFRYLATDSNGGWTINNIYEYNGSSWDETVSNEGFAVYVEDEDVQYTYNGSSWVTFGSTTSHNSTSGLQGGTSNEYYHLTSAQHTDLTDSGDSTLHYHSADRNRSNHTGSQLASTISDFETAVLAISNTSVNRATTSAASYTIDATSEIEFLLCSLGSSQSITLPGADEQDQIKIAKTASGGTTTISRAGADTIEGGTSISLAAQYQTVVLISDGVSTWYEM